MITDENLAIQICKALRDTQDVWKDISFERVMNDLENNLPTKVAPMIAAHWQMSLAMAGENPNGHRDSDAMSSSNIKIKPIPIGEIPGTDLDMYLIFGASGNRSGRVVGMELRLPKSGWRKLWRMDSHGYHNEGGDLFPSWKSNGFH